MKHKQKIGKTYRLFMMPDWPLFLELISSSGFTLQMIELLHVQGFNNWESFVALKLSSHDHVHKFKHPENLDGTKVKKICIEEGGGIFSMYIKYKD